MVQTSLNDAVDIGKATSVMQKRIDRDLIRSVEDARHGTAGLTCALGERQAPERLVIGRIERKLPECAKIETLSRRIPTIGI